MGNTLYLVIPCYNEEAVLPVTAQKILEKIVCLVNEKKISNQSRILFVDDGSKDKTWTIITSLHQTNQMVSGLKLSRNQGHQNALLAGLTVAKESADLIISMDADLQDDIHAIDEFVNQYHLGYEVVYGVRQSRAKDTIFKRNTAQLFYKFMKSLGVDIVYNHADYRLMSQRAVQALCEFKEVNLFLRGIIPLIGFTSTNVYYDRQERFAGESKYPLKKMIAFAVNGITSLSVKPIRLITALGVTIFSLSLLYVIYVFITYLFDLIWTVPGWNSLIVSIWLLGGLQLLALGTVGEYVGKIYLEAKQRPKYIIDSYLNK